MPRPILTLTTDFGADGPYAAALKGVVLGMAPDAVIVDVSHRIAPQNILEGAFMLASILDAFPAGTVHLGVVDPGVGTDRALAAARVAGQWFVGPDNGLLGGVVRGRALEECWEISNPALRRLVVSHTFHGRDILAPAAAHLLLGRPARELGPPRAKVVELANFDPRPCDEGLVAEVIVRDTFGNLVTNVRGDRLDPPDPAAWTIEIAGRRIDGLVNTYAERPPGALVALVGSSGWVEVAVVNGDAAGELSAGPGATVWFRRRAEAAASPPT
jgi:S-adenosylmethionine hydrolase